MMCPMKAAGGEKGSRRCERELCAWWVMCRLDGGGEVQGCAVALASVPSLSEAIMAKNIS